MEEHLLKINADIRYNRHHGLEPSHIEITKIISADKYISQCIDEIHLGNSSIHG